MSQTETDAAPLTIAVIVASTREGRFADIVADWFVRHATARNHLVFDVIDLDTTPLPTRLTKDRGGDVQAFTDRLAAADGLVVITPEYNHSFPASIKHAVDFVQGQLNAKPVAFVSYGGISGGLRAVEQLRLVFAERHMATMRDGVSFHLAQGRFVDGEPVDAAAVTAAADLMLDQLVWWATALRAGRRAATYPTQAW
jgi:NAD(P)H-dependent FMN reductase